MSSYVVASSPHLLDGDSTPRIMRRVCLALSPALLWSWYVFGWTAPVLVLASVAACVAVEDICCRLRRVPSTIGDWSAVVTGALLACVLPANIPVWLAMLGGAFAIAIGKQAFGGLGANIWNPALLARAFLQNSRPGEMMSGDYPWLSLDGGPGNLGRSISGSFAEINAAARPFADAVSRASHAPEAAGGGLVQTAAERAVLDGADLLTAATAMTAMHNPPASPGGGPPAALLGDSALALRTWLGAEGGALGEVSAFLLLLGGLYLLWKKVVTWEIPACFMAAAGLLGWILPHPFRGDGVQLWTEWFSGPWLTHLGGGGLMIGAWFMATDMVTGPLTRKGKMVFGAGCGLLTVLIRLYGGYPEGVCYAILLMNTCVPLIDRWTRPKVFGTT